MRKLLAMARTRIGYAAVGALLTLAAGGVATAAVIDSPATDEVSDVSTVTTPAAETTEPEVERSQPTVAATTEAPVPVEQPAADAPTATVEDVTPTRSGPSLPPGHRLPDLAPGQDPEGAGSIGPDGNYTPAPPIQYPGDAPLGPDANAKPPAAEPLPGEPGYVPPGG